MAKSKHKEAFPIRDENHIKESYSRQIFEARFNPWIVFAWIPKDYGIDAIVEITKSLSNSRDQIVTGKRFSVQIKSSSSETKILKPSLSIPIDKINYWYNSIEPVLLLFIDLNTEKCFYRWIDEQFISELFSEIPDWISKDSVVVKFDTKKTITTASISEIEEYVVHWRRPAKSILTPGNYFKYSQEITSFIEEFSSLVNQYRVPFLAEEVSLVKEKIGKTIYTIAIVGPSRSGKSTLINTILRRKVSPVGILPTTGVPITISPNNRNQATIVFKNGKQKTGEANVDFLEDYTSQDKNPNNQKNVKLVSVSVVNQLLEKGFALCDVPGLDDPDPQIVAVTKTALHNVNAIVYVISVAPMLNGEFSITSGIVSDLAELGSKMERLFLVFNKIDYLNTEQLETLKAYVLRTIEKFDILKYLPTSPIFISAQTAFEIRNNSKLVDDSVTILENEIWEFLLRQNKSGLHKLLSCHIECKDVISKIVRIVESSLVSDEKRKLIKLEINKIDLELSQLGSNLEKRKNEVFGVLINITNEFLKNIITYMHSDLRSVGVNTKLPESSRIARWLEEKALLVMSHVYTQFDGFLMDIQGEINSWISERINLMELSIDMYSTKDSTATRNNSIAKYVVHQFDHSEAENEGVLEKLIIGITSILSQAFDAIKNLVLTDESKRENEINSIVSKAERGYKKISKDFLSNIKSQLYYACNKMKEQSSDRVQIYLQTLKNQLNNFDHEISDFERRDFEEFLMKVKPLIVGVNSNLTHLDEYTNGIS